MKWLPEWLGLRYLKLFDSFGFRVFSLDEACGILEEGRERVRVVLSELCRGGWVLRLDRGKYLALPPSACYVRGEWEKRVRQREYLPLIVALSARVLEWLDGSLVSMAIYGSVARGEAKPNSDLDALVVSEDFPKSYSKRVEAAVGVLEPLKHLKLWLWRNKGIYCNTDLLMLTKAEASLAQPIYLDMVFDSVIVYDRGGFLSSVFERLGHKLRAVGAERIELPSKRWFWRFGAVAGEDVVVEL